MSVFALLTFNQTIDRPSKEPPLGLGSFSSLRSRMIELCMNIFRIFVISVIKCKCSKRNDKNLSARNVSAINEMT